MANNTDTIEREIFVNAPPEAVFRYLVEAISWRAGSEFRTSSIRNREAAFESR